MNKRIGRIGAFITAAFLMLVANLTYLQFFAASELTARPENIRPILYEQKIERGKIISADGTILAESKKSYATYTRRYPEGDLTAPVTGFYSTKYGRSGLELTFDEYLSGQTKVSSPNDYMKRLLGKDAPGNDLTLTLDMGVQRAAAHALGSKKGAVVVLNPKTGAILALVSNPSYDPNTVDKNWNELTKSSDGLMLNRALQGRFTPGSSFKTVTAAAALQKGTATPENIYDAQANVKIYGGKVTNFEGKDYGKMTFADAFAKSVNTVFAQVGKALGGDKLVETAKSFGFDSKVPFDLPTAESRIPDAPQMDELEVAWASVGQGRVQATPLQMALVAAGIANGGEIMQPYLVDSAHEHNGNTVYQSTPRVWVRPVTKETAETINSLMQKVVDVGTGRAAALGSVKVAGKTGTAEVGDKPPHAWFIGFAPADDPQVALAVIVENGGQGGRVAAPIAREIMTSALGKNH